MPAASVSIHSIRRRSAMRAVFEGASMGVQEPSFSAPARRDRAALGALKRSSRVARMDEQLRRRSVGAPAARSVLLTVLGEYVLPLEDAVWQETLIAALGALEHKPQAARQALARSVAAGWLRTERHGRRSRVRLTEAAPGVLGSGGGGVSPLGG